ncbi:MAG: metal ABC transporter permease [Leptospiraceae bacterium]|nr:metal ABC transporter permease [Leptospiraceae bacterium]
MDTSVWQFQFMQNAVLASILVSITCGFLGTLVTTNRLVFASGGLAHAAYGGVGLAWFSGWPIYIGVLLFLVPLAIVVALIQGVLRERAETLIGVMWAGGMALGVILIDLTPGYKSNLMSYLFGSLLTVSYADLFAIGISGSVIAFTVILFYPSLMSVAQDSEYARSRGLPVSFLQVLVLLMVAVGVVALMRTSGLILMIALLTIPAAISRAYVQSWRGLILGSSMTALVINLGGLAISWIVNISSSAASILVAALLYFLNLAFLGLTKRI